MAESSLGRNRVFQIKNDDGTPFHNLVLHKATYDSVVMSLGDKITGDVYYKDNKLDVTMNEYIEFARDPDDSNEEPVKFILVNPPTIVKEGIVSDNSELKGMTKYSFEFYHPMCKLGNMPLTDIAVTQDEERYLSQNKTFSWCGTGNDFIAKLNANLYYSEWIVVASENEQSAQRLAMMPSEVPTKKVGEQAKSNILSFDKNTIADGLKTIYETWDIPFVVDALHQGEYYDADGKDYYSEEGGNKRFVVIVGMPSNEIIDTESEFGVVVNATQIANGNIYYGGQPISVQKGKKIVLQSLTDGATPMILNSSHNGVIGTTSKTFEADMTIYVGLYPKSGYVKYFYDGDGDNIFVFRYGQGVGLKNNSRTPRNNKIITRISASGSEDNIPYGYPQIQWTGSEDDPRLKYPLYKGIVGGQYVTLIKHPFTRTRLMPSVYVESVNKKVNPNHPLYDPDTELVDYYDADSTYENPIIASSPSYEIHEFDGIKPELDSDRQIAIQGAIPLNDDLTPADSWVDDLKPDTDEYAQSYFRITLPPLGFDVYACASITQQMQINMRSGACIGCTFEIQVDWDDYKANFYDSDGNFDPAIGQGHPRDAQKYPNSTSSSINVVVKKEISTFGTLMPNIYQQPKSGDLFVILGISLPQIYITNAQQRLDALAKQYMRENNTYYFDYPLKFDEYFLAKYPSILRQIRTNTIIRFDYAGQTLHLCVKQITIKFGEKQLPQYNITLTDNIDVVLNQISQIANDVSRISTMAYQNAKQTGSGGSGNAQDKLSKLIDDTANGIITFAKGIKIGLQQLFGWDADGNITANNISAEKNISAGGRLNVGGNGSIGGDLRVSGVFDAIEAKINSLQSHNYSGSNLGDTGWKLTNNDGSGNSLLEVDKLLVRMKATFMELEIRKETFSGGNNHYSPAGSVIFKVDFLTEDNKALGYRNQKVPWLLKGISFLFGNKSYTRQRHIRYAFTLDQLTPEEYAKVAKFRCYLISDDGTTATRNWWQVGDQPRCQSFNKAISREEKRQKARRYDTTTPGEEDPTLPMASDFWWRLITECGAEVMDDGKVYDFVDLPFELYDKYKDEYAHHPENFCAAGSGYPQEGDTIVCMGNRVDPARMNLVSIISVDTDYSNAPAIKAWRGIHTFSFDGCEVFGFSYEKVRVQSRSFEWITDEGNYLPNILERGAYQSGVRYHWYDRVSHHGSMWLCQIADAKIWVDASGNTISTPPTADIVKGEGVYVYDQANNRRDRYYSLAISNGTTYGYYVQNWTYDEPTDTNNNWLKQVSKGTEITDSVIRYAASLSGITPPNVETSWKETIEATGIIAGQYLWTRTTTYYSDGRTPTVEYSVARWGVDGDGIASIDSFYWATTEVVAMTKAWDDAHLLPWNASASQEAKKSMWAPTYSDLETVWGGAGNMQGMYVWEKTIIKYDMANNPDGTPVTKPDLVSYQCNRIGNDGLIGEEEYYFLAESDDFATVFGNPSQAASYVYAKTGIRWYTEDTPITTDLPAAENYRLSSSTPNICTSAAQQTTAATPIWSPTMPTYAGDAKKYLWNFEQRVDGTGTQYATKPICLGNHARGITGVIELYALSSSKTPISIDRPIPTDINNKNTWGVIPTSGFSDPNVWGDERYDRAPTEQYPYQWNWTRTLYSDGGYEDHYHVSASRGTKGEDGAGTEYIYCCPQSHNSDGTPLTVTIPDPNVLKDKDGVDRTRDYIKSHDDFVPYRWTDNPVGIDFTHQIEYQAERKSTAVAGVGGFTGGHEWGLFSTPKTWSKWGQNGMDGDGVEYVYIRTNSDVAPTIVNSPDSRTDSHGRSYLDDEYLPLAIGGTLTTNTECTDDPLGTDANHRYEWMAKRVMNAPNPETGERTWKKYSGTMALHHNFAESITKVSETYRYATNNTGVRPSSSSTDWSTTKPTLQKGYWLYTETTITWSDGSTTVLYTDERNPVDGVAGQDIVTGTTVVTYCVSDTNTQQPDDNQFRPYSEIVSQIQPTKWLWSKSTTPYYKANDQQSGHEIGFSSNYTVSYIAKNGTSVVAQYSVNGTSNWHEAFAQGDKYMRTSEDSGTTWSSAMKIVGENGDNGDYTDFTFAISASLTTADASTKPSDTPVASSWSDSPVATTSLKPYLWCQQVTHTFSNGTETVGTPKYFRMTGEIGRAMTGSSEHYNVSNSNNPSQWDVPSSGEWANEWTTNPNVPNSQGVSQWNQNNKYLWNYERIEYTSADGTVTISRTAPRVIAIWTEDGRGIDHIVNYYAINDDTINPPAASQTGAQGWDDDPIAPNETYPYLWNFERIYWTSGTPSYTDTDKHVIGHYGSDGDDGSYYVEEYARSSRRDGTGYYPQNIDGRSVVSPIDNAPGWSSSAPSETTSYPYIWKRTTMYNPNTGEYSGFTYVCQTGREGDNYRNVDAYKSGSSTPSDKPSATTISDNTTDVGYGWSLTRPSGGSGEIVIGSGSGTNNTIPVDAYYKYSLTQQIYTSAEIGQAGSIKSLSFYNSSSSSTRTINIYLVNTSKSSFSSGTDWITVSNSDLVFSGSVTFASGQWTKITLPTPFAYSGNNLAIIIDDNTGSYTSQTPFATFGASSQAIQAHSDTTNYNPTSPSDSGNVLSSKNQLKIEMVGGASGNIYVSSAKFKNGTIIPTGTVADWSDPVRWNGEDGTAGQAGHIGRFYYFDGEWSSSKVYRFEKNQAPYVKASDGKFYMLDFAAHSDVQQSDATRNVDSEYNPVSHSGGDPWSLMNSEQQYYIAKAFFGEYAQFGSFIINGDWMISKCGILYDTSGGAHTIDETHSYGRYTIDNGYTYFDTDYPNSSKSGYFNFCPNYAVDGLTGKTYQNAAYVNGTIKADLFYGGVEYVTDDTVITGIENAKYTYFVEGATEIYTVTLPAPIEGVELRFFSPIMPGGASQNVMKVYYSGGIWIPSINSSGQKSTFVSRTEIALRPFQLGTVKSINGKWWVIDDGFQNPTQ